LSRLSWLYILLGVQRVVEDRRVRWLRTRCYWLTDHGSRLVCTGCNTLWLSNALEIALEGFAPIVLIEVPRMLGFKLIMKLLDKRVVCTRLFRVVVMQKEGSKQVGSFYRRAVWPNAAGNVIFALCCTASLSIVVRVLEICAIIPIAVLMGVAIRTIMVAWVLQIKWLGDLC
jgi:hypothetical protein